MSRLTGWVGVAIAMIIVKSSDPVAASLVDAGDITSVYASAPYFDTRLEDENGCDPAGCVAGLTRDGDSSTPTSRWSCTPALGPVGTICSIVYDLDAPLNLQQLRVGTGMSPDLALKEHGGFSMIKGRVDSTVGLSADTPNTLRACSEEYVGRVRFVADRLYPHVDIPHSLLALYEGDMRQRTLEVYVEGVLATNWTSSGTTTDFETIELPGTPAQMVELRGVLSRSEWLSITEVEIMAYDGTTVEVGTLATVETSATYFDTRVSDENGCDPEGCEPSKTRDDDLSDNSRWSCSPQLGGDCIITYDLGAVYDLSELMLAFYRGTERTRTLDIIVDGTLVTTWTSSGTTDGFQRIDVSGQSGQVIELLGDLPDGNSWLSITETRIMVVHDGMPPSPTPSNPTTPSPVAPGAVPVTRTTSDGRLIVEAGELDWVVLSPQSTNLHDSSLAAEGGCDPIGCVKEYTRDGSLDANSRWSCQFTPSSSSAFDMARYQCRIFYDLRDMREIYAVRVAFHLGDERTRTLEVWVDDVQYVPEWTSSGATADFETIPMPSSGIIGQDITIRANLDVDEWISITEVEIDVVVDDVPLLGVSASDRTTVTATASAGDPDLLLDGVTDDSASSWACSGEDCSVTFDVQDVEELVQISMAFVEDGNIASNIFDVSVAIEETGPFTKVLTDIPSNKDRPLTPQQFKITELARFIRIEPSTLGSGSLDITEVDIRVGEEVPIRGVAVDTSLQAVGLLPLAEGSRGDERTEEEGGCGTQGCRLFNLKDGDMSTFWRCYGSPEDPTSTYITYDCRVDIDFHYFRHLKQIRIALPDGAERATQMRFTARRAALVGADHVQESVMSSGLTDGFETYDFDVLTQTLEVQAVFNGALQSISIAELEFLEEPWMDGQIPVTRLGVPYSSGRVYPEELLYENGFAWGDDENVIGSSITFNLAFYATVSAISLKFPVGTRYKFDLVVYDVEEVYEDGIRLEGLESADEEDFQVFSLDFVPAGIVVDSVSIVMQGTVDGDDAFVLLDGRVYGTIVDNPTNMYTVGSTATDYWTLIDKYPDFVAEGSSDQNTIMEAICTVKKATFDGVNCVGGDPDATGEVELAMGDYYLDGPVYMQSGVFLKGRYTDDDAPYITEFNVQDGSAGISEEAAVLVFNGIENASTRDIWIRGQYDPDTDNSVSAVSGFGSKCLEIVNCKNVTAGDADVRNCDGDAFTVVNSQMVNIDAGRFDDEFLPWSISNSRGIGLLIENSDSVWIRRHTLYNNGEAGLVIRDTRNVTFEATFNYEYSLGEGNVGSLDGQQPIEVVIEGTSTMITFDHMRVTSTNEPAITVGPDSTNVKFVECVFSAIDSGACVIEAANPSVVDITDSDEVLTLQDQCFVKV